MNNNFSRKVELYLVSNRDDQIKLNKKVQRGVR